MTSSFRDQRGLSLPEILIALAILTVGLLGVIGPISGGVVAGMEGGRDAITRAYYLSTATVLAQERLEQVRRLQYTIGPPAVDQINAPTPAGFADEDFGAIAAYPAFSRTVTVLDATPGPNLKTVTVTMRFRFPTTGGLNTEGLAISTIMAARP